MRCPPAFADRVAWAIPWAEGRAICRSWMTPELPYRPALHARNRRWLKVRR